MENNIGAIQPYSFEPDASSDEEQEDVHRSSRLQVDVSEWCSCGKCITMPIATENICCWEIPKVVVKLRALLQPHPTCMSLHPGLEPVCLDEYALENALNIFRALHGPMLVNVYNAQRRYLAYRQFVSWVWGYLGHGNRIVIPSCVMVRIHQQYPDPEGNYVGFLHH
ncbi:P2X purinoceptor 7-like isoform X1 [Siphateles boraxobius]|uniref:P2X purinoceptor 7-like isoform X1 n=1 Tax=Siphateles boraxobius TaxID=180520 RepID=UPI0040639D8A